MELKAGNYFLREVKPAQGYALDASVREVTITSNQTTTFEVSDIPQNDPILLLLGKADKETSSNKALGSATLEGAEFTVSFYAGQYSSVTDAQASGNPTRSWVLKTDGDGYCRLDNAYLVSGDAFYRNAKGDPTFPLGTYLIQETKAPTGYLINDEIFLRNVTGNDTGTETVETYNAPTGDAAIAEQVKRGDFSFDKRAGVGGAAIQTAFLCTSNIDIIQATIY